MSTSTALPWKNNAKPLSSLAFSPPLLHVPVQSAHRKESSTEAPKYLSTGRQKFGFSSGSV
jgi:hypothetical protein